MPDTTTDLLRARFNELLADRDAKQAVQKPFRDEINAKYEQIAAIQAEIDALAAEMHTFTPALAATEEELARIAMALGGRRMSDAA